MASLSETSVWLSEDDMLELEPSLMTTGICPGSVFDKFGWDADFFENSDELLDEICIKTESDEDPLSDGNTDFGSLGPIFPDLIVDDTTKSNNTEDSSYLGSSTSLNMSHLSSISKGNNDRKIFREDSKNTTTEETLKTISTNINNFEKSLSIDNCLIDTDVTIPTTVIGSTKNMNNSAIVCPSLTTMATVTNTTTVRPGVNSIIRIPVKRSAGALINGTTGGRIKAVVVCPDRSKSIVCNVVRSSNKGIVIQKPVNRSWLNVCGSIRSESSKLPIKVNVISSKESNSQSLNIKNHVTKTELPVEVKQEPKSDSLTDEITTNFVPVDSSIETLCTESMLLPPTNIKIEPEEIRPETPQSLIGSDEDFRPFSSPNKDHSIKSESDSFQDDFMKSFLLDEDNLCSDSYKCFPPAEITGQIQPIIPDIFKYTPNSSPTSNGDSLLDSFYPKLETSYSSSRNQFYNKAAANVDHDYGFTCRTPKSTNSITSIFNVDSLGIQTPSASEPPTDSDDDDHLIDDVTLLNKDFDCSELDREQSEYFENLKHQLKLAELVCKTSEKEHRLLKSTSLKERKAIGRNRKRKLSRERSSPSTMSKNVLKLTDSNSVSMADVNGSVVVSGSGGTLKIRLPVREGSAKKRKTSSGGRIFSPSERHLHNTNEQVRRIEMRQSFEELRRLIPNLLDKPRAPKVSILQEAKTYCDELFHVDLKLQAQVTALKCQQERLRCSLSRLRRHVAASRH